MSEPVEVSHELPVINHVRIPCGAGKKVRWGFGPTASPENLTGRSAVLVLNPGSQELGSGAQRRVPLTTEANWVIWNPDETAWESGSSYAVLVEDTPGGKLIGRVRGKLNKGLTIL